LLRVAVLLSARALCGVRPGVLPVVWIFETSV
jgi:hypothetical protein